MKSTLWKHGNAVKSKDLPKELKLEQKHEQNKTYNKLMDATIKTEEVKDG